MHYVSCFYQKHVVVYKPEIFFKDYSSVTAYFLGCFPQEN